MSKYIQVYLLPAAVFLSVMIGGGYGTGREVVEFFTRFGPLGGLFAIASAAVAFALVLGCTFEFARTFRVYDYRSFFKHLIGPAWMLFEILYVLLFLLVLGVVSAAASDILKQRFDVPAVVGLIAMPLLVAFFVLFGRLVVERALALWSVLMYGVFITYFVVIISQPEVSPSSYTTASAVQPGWLLGGLLYALYNVAVAPGLLFVTRAINTRRQAFISALICAITLLIPAVLFHLSYTRGHPDVLEQPLPNYWMIQQFAPDWLLTLFIIALLGTLIETGVGLVQSVIERLPITQDPENDRKGARALVALSTVSLAALLGTLGIVSLIDKGYTLMSYGFAVVYVLPVCTLGIHKFLRRSSTGLAKEHHQFERV